ncbi:MAG TPA: Ig-like domain-containing protein [Terriglobales bacterium]|nr:Ig-like domain-containing protein [Terriglobales bacterium]
MFTCTLLRSIYVRLVFTVFCVIVLTSAAMAGVVVNSPANGATVSSPAHVVASASSTRPISAMRIYVDGRSAYTVGGGTLNTHVSLSPGWHSLVVQAWDTSGAVFKQVRSVNVVGSAPSGGSTAPGGAIVHSNIDSMGGWDTCARCAGHGGTGPATPHYVTYNVRSPSMDGASAKFVNAGVVSYSNAIWWKQVGARDSSTHFIYDLYFYIKDVGASQALEFDVNQSVGGRRYIFGTECGVSYNRQWSVWGNNRWNPTGIGCSITPYTWNHLVEESYRANGRVHIVSITLNGKKHYVNRSYDSIPSGARDLNVAFQMDQTAAHRAYGAWLDKVTLKHW